MHGRLLSLFLAFSLLLCVGCGAEKSTGREFELPSDAEALTKEELREYTEWFAQIENNGLLRFPYTNIANNPEQVVPYLEILMYDMGETDLSERELELLAENGAYMDLDKFRLSRTRIAEYLAEKFAIEADDAAQLLVSPEPAPAGIFLEEYDAWYIVHSDTWFEEYTMVQGGVRADGTVVLFYTNPLLTVAAPDGSAQFMQKQRMMITLAPRGDGWYVVSNEVWE